MRASVLYTRTYTATSPSALNSAPTLVLHSIFHFPVCKWITSSKNQNKQKREYLLTLIEIRTGIYIPEPDESRPITWRILRWSLLGNKILLRTFRRAPEVLVQVRVACCLYRELHILSLKIHYKYKHFINYKTVNKINRFCSNQ